MNDLWLGARINPPNQWSRAGGIAPPTALEQAIQAFAFILMFAVTIAIIVAFLHLLEIGRKKIGELKPDRETLISSGLTALVAIFSLIAIAPLPNNYYLALRVLVFAAGAMLAWQLRDHATRWLLPALVIAALLYNPFVPASLTKEIWMGVNLLTAALFGFVALKVLHKT